MKTIKLTDKKGLTNTFEFDEMPQITVDGEVVVFESKKVEFKRGDVVVSNLNNIFLLDEHAIESVYKSIIGLIIYSSCNDFKYGYTFKPERLATESEKQQLFDALAKEGKCWNPETMEVEELKWKPKDGDYYYYINSVFTASETSFLESYSVDNNRIEVGNYFQTESECLAKIEQIKAILK